MSSIPLSPVAAALSSERFAFLQRFVHDQAGVVLEAGKEYLVQSRLAPLVERERLSSIDDLCARLASPGNASLAREVVEAMTTNETFFFRDIAPFESLKREVLPELVRSRDARKRLRVWSAAASTGQEAYSLAMLLLEAGLPGWRIEILATDYTERVLARARAGRYSQLDVNRGLPAQLLVRYFDRVGAEWQVRDAVRSMVTFEQFDLRAEMRGFGPFDLVLCRNVLIYFDRETKRSVLARIAQAMEPDGLLLLGAAENVINMDVDLRPKMFGRTTFYQTGTR